MKLHYLATLLLGISLTAGAQGYKDGIEYYKAGQYDNAVTVLSRNLNNAETDKALANYYLGQSYLAMGDKAKAKTYFDAGVAANPDCAYNYVGLGALDLLNNAKSAAEDKFKTAQKLAKKNNEVLVDIARAYYRADPTNFAKEIEKYIQKARKNSKNREPAIYIFEGDRKARNKDFNAAATEYEQAIYFDKDNPEGYVKYANTYFYTSPEYAIQRLEELLALKPNSALAQRELAEKYYQNDQWSRAAEQYGKYIENPNHFPEDKARYAILLYAGDNFRKSLEVAREVLAHVPNDITLQRLVVRNLDKLGNKPEALEKIREYFNNPANAEAFNVGDFRLYSQLLSANGHDSLAVEQVEKGLKMFPNNGQLVRELSDAFYNAEKFARSADVFHKYLLITEKPTTNDYYVGSTRSLRAITEVSQNDSLRIHYADQGLSYMEQAIDPADPRPAYLWRKALLQINRDQHVDQASEATFKQLLAILDAEPEYSNPANENNYLQEYVLMYQYLIPYYEGIEDQAAADNAKAQYEKYKALFDSTKQ